MSVNTSYFHLHTKVYVSKDETFSELVLLNVDDLNTEEKKFVGVGYTRQEGGSALIQKGFSGPLNDFDVSMDRSNPNYFSSMLSWNAKDYVGYIDHTGVMFTYLRKGQNNNPIKLYCIKSMFDYEDDGKAIAYFIDIDQDQSQRPILGKIVFECSTDKYYSDFLIDTPFTVNSEYFVNVETGVGENLNFLCYNWRRTSYNDEDLDTETEAKTKYNGGNWDCALYIIDPDNPLFYEKRYKIKTLELPSVYRPFYIRSVVAISNKKDGAGYFPVRAYSNVYNGVGFFRNGKYDIGTFSFGINGTQVSTWLSGYTPTLLSTYEDSIHEISVNDIKSIQSLDGINITFNVMESGPTEGYSLLPFSRSVISYNKTVSFYNYDYPIGFDETRNFFVMTFYDNTFQGSSNNEIKYFIVSQKILDIILDKPCNTKQIYELNPEIARYNSDYEDNYEEFLSLYGISKFDKLSNYRGQHVEFRDEMQAIFIDYFDFKSQSESGETFYFEIINRDDLKKNWHVIGITDPLIDLLTQDEDLFYKELENGSVLAPHQNFVSIITYK